MEKVDLVLGNIPGVSFLFLFYFLNRMQRMVYSAKEENAI